MDRTAEELVGLIKQIINEELDKRDATTLGVVTQVANGGISVRLANDDTNVITGVKNPNNISCKAGDLILIYKVNNKLNNSFVIVNYSNS